MRPTRLALAALLVASVSACSVGLPEEQTQASPTPLVLDDFITPAPTAPSSTTSTSAPPATSAMTGRPGFVEIYQECVEVADGTISVQSGPDRSTLVVDDPAAEWNLSPGYNCVLDQMQTPDEIRQPDR